MRWKRKHEMKNSEEITYQESDNHRFRLFHNTEDTDTKMRWVVQDTWAYTSNHSNKFMTYRTTSEKKAKAMCDELMEKYKSMTGNNSQANAKKRVGPAAEHSCANCPRIMIGKSDIAALVLAGTDGKTLITGSLLFGQVGEYAAYIADGQTDIPKNCTEVFTSKEWIRIYDDQKQTLTLFGKYIKVYRFGKTGVVIQVMPDAKPDTQKE